MDSMERYMSHLLQKGADAREIARKCSRKYGVDENLLYDMVEYLLERRDDDEYLSQVIKEAEEAEHSKEVEPVA